MKNFFKLQNLLFCFLSMVLFLLLGMTYAGVTGAADGQGLAGGAIVLGYGILWGIAAFIISIFLVFYIEPKWIRTLNLVFAGLLILLWVFFYIRNRLKSGEREPPGFASQEVIRNLHITTHPAAALQPRP